MTHHIQHQVDQLLLEQGEYLPLEFLLQEERLSYTDYEAWRSGELDCLDDALFGDLEHIQQQLMQVEDYLQRRGWQAETISYHAWCSKDSQPAFQPALRPLCFSANSKLNLCFHHRYRKPQDQPQMDLFTDAPATSLVNGITHALINRNSVEARRLLKRLDDTAPDNTHLGELERLLEAVECLRSAVSDIAREMQVLHESLVPLAEILLGKDSRNLLIPLWRRLSIALQDRPYKTTEPELHLSYTATQAMDWDVVCQAVEGEPLWQTDPVLLLRHAQACGHLRQKPAALLSWFRLCWQFPERCNVLESISGHELRQQWAAFLELEPELPAPSFPAWLLLSKPSLTRILPEPGSPSSKNEIAYPASYRTLYRLQHNRMHSRVERGNAENNTMIMALRAQLKQQDPVLFQHFFENIEAPS